MPGRAATAADPDHVYELLVVGGGPAAMSAALYAARKDLDVAMIAAKIGGQITYTASVENYLGMREVGGQEMAELFREHMEGYPVALAVGSAVERVARSGEHFTATCADGRTFKGYAVVFATGKEYRRLGVPGEERWIGHGIGFCATCDAPLYRGKRVAVVGGGNSAFTAARDLLGFASEIHLVHWMETFQADPLLVTQVLSLGKVVVHSPYEVTGFLGKERLEGVRLRSADGKGFMDLPVEGVFLEIGLVPNSKPVNGLVRLNQHEEVVVSKDQSTDVPGLFAAGDVTDVADKQIAIAVGDGAKAALSAHRYLIAAGRTRSRIGPREG